MTLRILVPTDFSPAAGAALTVVRAAFPQARTELLHVVPSRSPLAAPLAAGGGGADPSARQRLEALGGGTLVSGSPADEVLRRAREGGADLIALGRVGERGGGPGRVGAVAERVLQGSSVPVLSVPVPSSPAAAPPTRALVLMDFSPGALAALRFLERCWPGLEVHRLHVVDGNALETPFALASLSAPLRGASSWVLQQRNALWEAEARQRLETLGGGEIARGAPAEVALERARGGEYAVLALGASAKRGLDRLLFGSVARRVVQHAPVPVLTARGAPGPTA
ncbi:universal stress protein [Deinococcus budaensis]|uniref:Nucleotide-binding universal stress UspA family protein n=1 Tax=Deinococcus budaensis TaxID=1665626 RepID=A0A7W8GE17_9DEIO|nr:universal stress protein [Deinococcus budaensis]MBB5233907.1 nucleotide-binding universal stress UspA family protein [Deinococcus budaensis]